MTNGIYLFNMTSYLYSREIRKVNNSDLGIWEKKNSNMHFSRKTIGIEILIAIKYFYNKGK